MAACAALAVGAASDGPRLGHINQCMGGGGQHAIGNAIAGIKTRLKFSKSSNTPRVLSVLSFGDEPSGLHHWADLLGESFGRRVDIDLSEDVAPLRAALTPSAGGALHRAVEALGEEDHLVITISGLEKLFPSSITSANVLMPLLDASQAYVPVSSAFSEKDRKVFLDKAGLVVVLLQYDHGAARNANLGAPEWANATSEDARTYLKARWSAFYRSYLESSGSNGGSDGGQRRMNLDALMGRISTTVVLPPLTSEEEAEWKHKRDVNELCRITHAGRGGGRKGLLESITEASSYSAAYWGGLVASLRSAGLVATVQSWLIAMEKPFLPAVARAQAWVSGRTGIKAQDVSPAYLGFAVGIVASPLLALLVILTLKVLGNSSRAPVQPLKRRQQGEAQPQQQAAGAAAASAAGPALAAPAIGGSGIRSPASGSGKGLTSPAASSASASLPSPPPAAAAATGGKAAANGRGSSTSGASVSSRARSSSAAASKRSSANSAGGVRRRKTAAN